MSDVVEFHPKIASRLAQIEAALGHLQREHLSIRVSTLLAQGIDPDLETWQYDQERHQMTRRTNGAAPGTATDYLPAEER